MPLVDVLDKLRAARIPFAPVRRPDQLANDEHLLGAGQFVSALFPDGQRGNVPKLPFHAAGFEMSSRRDAPALGADSRQVLADCGYSDDEIDDLVNRHAVLAVLPAADREGTR